MTWFRRWWRWMRSDELPGEWLLLKLRERWTK